MITFLKIACWSFFPYVLILLSFNATGCATSSGKDFLRLPNDSLVLGTTTSQEVKMRLGAPSKFISSIKNNFEIDTYLYTFVTTSPENVLAPGIIPQRVQTFHFYDKKLVGYDFSSSFKQDNTDFDSASVKMIQVDSSNRVDVISILGEPNGRSIYPLIRNKNEEAIIYCYTQTRGSVFDPKLYQKRLQITLGENRIVKAIEYVDTGDK